MSEKTMSSSSVVIIGLPGSGKTTFLAALWHLINSQDVETHLAFHSLGKGNIAHLNAIAEQWRDAKVQERTASGGLQMVTMNLVDSSKVALQVTFPDVPGEAYTKMWEDRECDIEVVDTLMADSVLLFIHADNIESPKWVVDEVAMCKALGIALESEEIIPWHPKLAPTQVQLVDLLQLLSTDPLGVGPRRLAIMLSAWDKAAGEGLSPQEFLSSNLPLLKQYLSSNVDGWNVRIYGVSAQGGDYDDKKSEPKAEAEVARNHASPSMRIKLVGDGADSQYLTEPLAWLME